MIDDLFPFICVILIFFLGFAVSEFLQNPPVSYEIKMNLEVDKNSAGLLFEGHRTWYQVCADFNNENKYDLKCSCLILTHKQEKTNVQRNESSDPI